MTDWHFYSAYGIAIRATEPIAGLAPSADGRPDLTIIFDGRVANLPLPDVAPLYRSGFDTVWHLDESTWLIHYREPATGSELAMRVEEKGALVHLQWTDGVVEADVAPFIQSTALAAVLHIRGVPLLHAAVVATATGAMLLIGEPGAGKSTTTAAFVRRGLALLSDDIAALEVHPDRVLVQSGYPRLRIYEETGRALGWTAEELPKIWESALREDKRFVELGPGMSGYCAEQRRVDAIYLLGPRQAAGSSPVIVPVEPREALPILYQNIFAPRYLGAGHRARAFRALAQVAHAVPVRRARAADSLAELPEFVDTLSRDAAVCASQTTAPPR
jgi:hypothetical protein